MTMLTADDGVKLYYEDTGAGTPIVFVHEFGGDHRSWEPQVRHFSRRYRCITYSARGYLPSEVPESAERYSQKRWRDDVRSVMDALGLPKAHVVGSSNTMLGYQGRRPSLYDLTDAIGRIDVPTLVMTGDEDEPCLEPSLLLKRTIPQAGLAVLPKSGHAINLEEPALFNQLVDDFFHQVEAGRWQARDPRAVCASIYGPGGKP